MRYFDDGGYVSTYDDGSSVYNQDLQDYIDMSLAADKGSGGEVSFDPNQYLDQSTWDEIRGMEVNSVDLSSPEIIQYLESRGITIPTQTDPRSNLQEEPISPEGTGIPMSLHRGDPNRYVPKGGLETVSEPSGKMIEGFGKDPNATWESKLAGVGAPSSGASVTPKAGDAGFLTSIKETLAKITPDKDTRELFKMFGPGLAGLLHMKLAKDNAQFNKDLKMKKYNDDLARNERINRSSVATPALKTVTRRVK